MNTARLVPALVGLLVLGLFAADSSAIYHPTMGRFLQRDPGPDGMMDTPRVAGGPVVGDGFLPRDQGVPAETPLTRHLSSRDYAKRDSPDRYTDGLNLQQYVMSNPTIHGDAMGLECGVTVRRIDVSKQNNSKRKALGHTWLQYPGGSMGSWPSGEPVFPGTGTEESYVASPDPDENSTPDREWTTSRQSGWWIFQPTLQDGKAKGKQCRCATCDEIIDCMKKRGPFYQRNYRWDMLSFDCRTFVQAVAWDCCLNIDGYVTW